MSDSVPPRASERRSARSPRSAFGGVHPGMSHRRLLVRRSAVHAYFCSGVSSNTMSIAAVPSTAPRGGDSERGNSALPSGYNICRARARVSGPRALRATAPPRSPRAQRLPPPARPLPHRARCGSQQAAARGPAASRTRPQSRAPGTRRWAPRGTPRPPHAFAQRARAAGPAGRGTKPPSSRPRAAARGRPRHARTVCTPKRNSCTRECAFSAHEPNQSPASPSADRAIISNADMQAPPPPAARAGAAAAGRCASSAKTPIVIASNRRSWVTQSLLWVHPRARTSRSRGSGTGAHLEVDPELGDDSQHGVEEAPLTQRARD